jgi:hypothetical protein
MLLAGFRVRFAAVKVTDGLAGILTRLQGHGELPDACYGSDRPRCYSRILSANGWRR